MEEPRYGENLLKESKFGLVDYIREVWNPPCCSGGILDIYSKTE